MVRKTLTVALVAGCLALAAGAPDVAAAGPQKVLVVNTTRFEAVAQDVVIPAGQTMHFDVRSDGFGRVSLLIAGSASAGGGAVSLVTLYGPPLVPAGPPRPLHLDSDGNIRDRQMEPVLGPGMSIVVKNDTSADATLTLSAYFAN